MYIPVEYDRYRPARDHQIAQMLKTDGNLIETPELSPAFFANPMQYERQAMETWTREQLIDFGLRHIHDDGERDVWRRRLENRFPAEIDIYERTYVPTGSTPATGIRSGWQREKSVPGSRVVLTYEIDSGEGGVELPFAAQLDWLMGRRHQRIIDTVHTTLKAFIEYVGLNITWSGNRSLHMHVVMLTGDFHGAGYFDGCDWVATYGAAWHRVGAHLFEVLDLSKVASDTRVFDPALATPYQLRRLPNGLRPGCDKNVWGLTNPFRTIPQVCLYETTGVPRRSSAGYSSVWDRQPILTMSSTRKRVSQGTRWAVDPDLSAVKSWIQDHVIAAPFPEIVSLHWMDDRDFVFAARLRNSADDRHPGSFIQGDHRHIQYNGTGITDAPFHFEAAFDEIVEEGIAAVHGLSIDPSPASSTAGQLSGLETARTIGEARKELANAILDRLIAFDDLPGKKLMIKSGEGLGKTTALMRYHHLLGHAGHQMVSFSTRDQAATKLNEFKALKPDATAVLLPSFSECYSEVCTENGHELLDFDEFREDGLSVFSRIQTEQPAVWRQLTEIRDQIRQSMGQKTVFFCTHQLSMMWHRNCATRRFISADPFGDGAELSLDSLVFDEVHVDELVQTVRVDQMDFCDDFAGADAKQQVWDRRPQNLELSLNAVRDVCDHRQHFDYIMPAQSQYVDENFTDRRGIGVWDQGLWVRPQPWVSELRSRIVILTTEEVPFCLAKVVVPGVSCMDVQTPNIPLDTVTVYPRRTSAAHMAQTVKTVMDEHDIRPDAIIANRKAAYRSVTDIPVAPHKQAKGSNSYLGKHVLSAYSFLAPEQVRLGECLNNLCLRRDICHLQSVDEMQQTIGRTMGARQTGSGRHDVVINRTLLNRLYPYIYRYFRYKCDIVFTNSQLRHKKYYCKNN